MSDRGALSVKTAVLLRKRGRQEVQIEPEYCGFEIPDAFVVGYGLDYDDDYRHLPYVAILPQIQGSGTSSDETGQYIRPTPQS